MDSSSNNDFPHPKRLKTLAFNAGYPRGNTLLHQFVLDNSDPNKSGTENYINAVLMSMSHTSVNSLNDEGYSALHLAVMKSNLLMVKKLLSCLVNIDVNTTTAIYKNTALHLASDSDNILIVEELLNKGAAVNALNDEGYSVLHLAVLKNNLSVVKKLLSSSVNIDVNATCNIDKLKNTALHLAADSGNLSIVQELLRKGANVNKKNSLCYTALLSAAKAGHLSVIEELLIKGAYVNSITVFGNTALFFAAMSGRLDIMKLLISKGADMNLGGIFGYEVPLHCAAKSGNLEAVKLLVNSGAYLSSAYINMAKVFQYATLSGNTAIIEFLKQKCSK